MAGQIIISNIKTDSDNAFSILANTGAVIFSANLASGITTGVSTAAIADGSITNAKLAGSITGDKITVGTLAGNVFTANTITGDKIGQSAISSNNIVSVDGSTVTSASITPAKLSQPFTSGANVASTSGTSIDFTSIPSWVKRITVMFSGVSTNGTSLPMIQLGDSGGIETTGYTAGSTLFGVSSMGSSNFTTGFTIRNDAVATTIMDGFVTLNLFNSSTNTWVAGGNLYAPTPTSYLAMLSGAKSLSATLDRVRITTVNGTDAFDAGSINILYE
jgi:hypothetical protein